MDKGVNESTGRLSGCVAITGLGKEVRIQSSIDERAGRTWLNANTSTKNRDGGFVTRKSAIYIIIIIGQKQDGKCGRTNKVLRLWRDCN
jgi:hypothetical protein